MEKLKKEYHNIPIPISFNDPSSPVFSKNIRRASKIKGNKKNNKNKKQQKTHKKQNKNQTNLSQSVLYRILKNKSAKSFLFCSSFDCLNKKWGSPCSFPTSKKRFTLFGPLSGRSVGSVEIGGNTALWAKKPKTQLNPHTAGSGPTELSGERRVFHWTGGRW